MTSGKQAIAVLAAACAAAAGFSGRLAAQNRNPAQPRLVWAAKPVSPTAAITPRNKEGQLHYTQPDVQEGAPSRVRPPRP